METRNKTWPLLYVASGLEIATFLSYFAEKNSLATNLLAITIAVDLYVYPQVYLAYKESKDFVDFVITDGDPIFSDFYKRHEKNIRAGLQGVHGFFKNLLGSMEEEAHDYQNVPNP